MDSEEHVSAPSTPATPGTPGAPLFGGFRGDRNTTPKKSLLSRTGNCFKVETRSIEEGGLPAVSCTMIMPPPPVPITKKVLTAYFCSWVDAKSGASRVRRHSHTDLCWDSHSNCQSKDTRIRDSYWLCCLNRTCCYDRHPLHWTHLWCPSESSCHHCLCSTKTLLSKNVHQENTDTVATLQPMILFQWHQQVTDHGNYGPKSLPFQSHTITQAFLQDHCAHNLNHAIMLMHEPQAAQRLKAFQNIAHGEPWFQCLPLSKSNSSRMEQAKNNSASLHHRLQVKDYQDAIPTTED